MAKKVFIGVGHGGSDPGATANNLKEKDLNLNVAVHYGCHFLKPSDELQIDNPKNPKILDELVDEGREMGQLVTDFTWYLRNLMLAGATDNIEDVIDASSENLARLKEEAQMADLDTVMRYIRIFSELSGQIRYATQKRIMIEMALIKVCRPAMETTQDAVLDRIRQVEEKVENAAILPASMDMSAFAGGAGGMGTSSGAVKKPRPELPNAIPDDIKEIVVLGFEKRADINSKVCTNAK